MLSIPIRSTAKYDFDSALTPKIRKQYGDVRVAKRCARVPCLHRGQHCIFVMPFALSLARKTLVLSILLHARALLAGLMDVSRALL
jgi:hypothetical protein